MAVVDTVVSFAASHLSLLGVAVFVIVSGAGLYASFFGGHRGRNPFRYDHRRPPEPFVHDTKVRDAVLKDRFKLAKVPDNLDAIIIGSGAGGLSAGVLLTFAGQKVLVLEQHDQAGGCCHTFVEKGFEFDTGVHYVGDINPSDMARALFDQVTCGQLRWAKMDDVFDVVGVGSSSQARLFPMKSGEGVYYQNLIEQFPQEKSAILEYERMVKDSMNTFYGVLALKMMPYWLARFLTFTGLFWVVLKCYRRGYPTTSVQQVLDRLTDNKELKLILSYLCGDYGVLPDDAPFFIHAILANHYSIRAYYPANGTSEVSYHMIKAIQAGGGRALVQAPVTKILCDSTGRAVGVCVGKNQVEIRAKYIISDAGVANTFGKLLPEKVARKSSKASSVSCLMLPDTAAYVASSLQEITRENHQTYAIMKLNIYPLMSQIGPSISYLTAFIGVDGSSRDLNLPAANLWLYNMNDINQSMSAYLSTKPEEIEDIDIPFSFISFPSAKDPEYETKFPGKTSALAITLANWDWFKEWKEGKVRHRGERYENRKEVLGRKLWRQCVDLFPQLEGKKVYMEVGTTVTNQHYLGWSSGEMYGLHQGVRRFTPNVASRLRPGTDIKGLYLTGQDTFMGGLVPVAMSGVMCASAILHRNLFNDLTSLQKRIQRVRPVSVNGSFTHRH